MLALIAAGGSAWPGASANDARAAAALPDGERLKAVEQLAAGGGPGAARLLRPFLRDADAGVRLFAARWLVRAGDVTGSEAAVSWIMTPLVAQIDRRLGLDVLREAPELSPAARHAVERALHDSEAMIRSFALEALERHDPAASLSDILGALEDDNREVRARAIRLAAMTGDPRAAPSLLARVEDADRQIRIDAIRALGSQPSARAALLRLANDGPDDVRAAAVDALGQLRAEPAIPRLIVLARRHPVDELGRRAQLALGKIGTADAIAGLLALARTPPVTEETKLSLRRAGPTALPQLVREIEAGNPTSAAIAVAALADIGDRRATAPLVRVVDRGTEIAPRALDALATLGDRTALAAIARAAETADADVRRHAFGALIRLADPRSAGSIERGLGDPDPRVREVAARLCRVLAARNVVPALVPLLADREPTVRRSAAEAIAVVGTPAPGALAAIVSALSGSGGAARDEDEWRAIADAVERVVEAADLDRLAAGFFAAKGTSRLPWVRGLSALGAVTPLGDERLVAELVAALANSDQVALEAADALAVARIPDGALAALARAFEAAEPALRARLGPAIAHTPDAEGWLAAIAESSAEPEVVRTAVAAAARAMTGGARSGWTEVRIKAADGTPEAGVRTAISGPGGVVVKLTTDAYGAVRVRGLPAGPLSLQVEAARARRGAP